MRLRYAVAGTGRSGTTFAWRLLRAAGSPIYGEHVFTWDRRRSLELARSTTLDVEADSSLAAFAYLDRIPPIRVLHLLRDPLKVLASWLAGFPHPGRSQLDIAERNRLRYATFLPQEVPEIDDHTDTIDRIAVYIERNAELIRQRTRGAYLAVRLEDLATGGDSVNFVLDWLNLPTVDNPDELVDSVGRPAPSKVPPPAITWADLEGRPTYELLRRHADRYGYL